jgi:hypothetical protein
MRRRWGLLVLCALAWSPASRAADPTPEPIQFAAHEHDMGYRAYVARHFDQAAAHFENAFFAAPNPAELRSAIRARREAGQHARAATLAAIGLRTYPDDGVLGKLAGEVIAEARPSVFEVQIASPVACNVTVDDKVVTSDRMKVVRFFVEPGKHDVVVGWSEGRARRFPIEAKPGGTQALTLDPPPPSPLPAAPHAARPLGPAVFFAGAGVTAVLVGVTVWSGLDAQKNPGADVVRADCVGQGEGCPQYQQGLVAQRRTNILLAATGAAAAVTGVLGLFFTEWSRPGRTSTGRTSGGRVGLHVAASIGPGEAALLGSF